MRKSILLLTLLFIFSSVSLGSETLPSMRAEEAKDGKVNVDIVYYAEDTCVSIDTVSEGSPSLIEPPKRSLVVTVVLDRKIGTECKQKLKVLNQKITIKDRPGVRAVEIFFISKDGKFIRHSKPRIYRGIEGHPTDEEPEIS